MNDWEKVGILELSMSIITVAVIVILSIYVISDNRITSGKTIIIENASYKCTKINELIRE